MDCRSCPRSNTYHLNMTCVFDATYVILRLIFSLTSESRYHDNQWGLSAPPLPYCPRVCFSGAWRDV